MKRSVLAVLAACALAVGPLATGAEEDPVKGRSGDAAGGREKPSGGAAPVSEEKATKAAEPSSGGGGLVAPLLVAVGGTVAGAGVGLARRLAEPEAQAPVASVTITPPDTVGIAGVTTFSLRADASDPDGSVASYAWDFGDGQTATGAAVTHRYQSAATFRPQVVVTDSTGDSSSASATVPVATLTGDWEWLVWSWENCGRVFFSLTQNGQSLTGSGVTSGESISMTGTISDPGTIALQIGRRPLRLPPSCTYTGYYILPQDYRCAVTQSLDKILCDGLALVRQ